MSPLEARGYGVAYSAAGRLSDRLDVELGMLAPESAAAMLERICSAGELRRAMVANQPTG